MTTNTHTEHHLGMVIAGDYHWSDQIISVANPGRVDEVVGTVTLGTETWVDTAVESAKAAFPGWRSTPPQERAAMVVDALAKSLTDVEKLAELMTREQGKLLWESRVDVAGALKIAKYYATLVDEISHDRHVIDDEHKSVWIGRRPVGPVGIIVPWNSPVYLAFLGIAPALIAGNPVIVKPPETAPLTLTTILKRLAENLPDGLVSCVPGLVEVGQAISAHPGIRNITFTGSTATGKAVMRSAAQNLKSVNLELGGNDPAIILPDADITDELVTELVRGVYTLAGQICFAIKRIYVPARVAPLLVDRFCAIAGAIRVGNGMDPRSTMGAIHSAAQVERIENLVSDAIAGGATCRTVGGYVPGLDPGSGHYVLPRVVTDIDSGSQLVEEEQFGPVVPIVLYESVDDVVSTINSSEYGLAASVWSSDLERARSIAREIDAGSVFLNVHRLGCTTVDMPFGGYKQSGIGRNHAINALYSYLEIQTIGLMKNRGILPGPIPTPGSIGS